MKSRTFRILPCLLVSFLCVPIGASAGIKLKSGDEISGEIVKETDGSIVVEHPELGRLTIDRDQLAPPEPEEPIKPGLFGTNFLEGWNRNFSAGINGTEGNSKTVDFNVDLTADSENESRRWNFKSAYFRSEQGSDRTTTKNQFFANLQRDWLFGESPFFLFTQARYDFDRFEDFEHRLAASLGAGYDIYTSDPFDLRGRLGAGFARTFGGNNEIENRFQPEGVVGLDAVWRLSETATFTASTSVYPELEEFSSFRAISQADLVMGVSETLPVAIKFSVGHEHISDTDAEEDDFRYGVSVLYAF